MEIQGTLKELHLITNISISTPFGVLSHFVFVQMAVDNREDLQKAIKIAREYHCSNFRFFDTYEATIVTNEGKKISFTSQNSGDPMNLSPYFYIDGEIISREIALKICPSDIQKRLQESPEIANLVKDPNGSYFIFNQGDQIISSRP